jgi:hypothetical protein
VFTKEQLEEDAKAAKVHDAVLGALFLEGLETDEQWATRKKKERIALPPRRTEDRGPAKKKSRRKRTKSPSREQSRNPEPGDLSPAQKWVALKSEFKGVGLYHKPRTPEERSFRRRFDVLKRTYGGEAYLPRLKCHPRDSRRRPAEKAGLRKSAVKLIAAMTSWRRNNSKQQERVGPP